MKLKIFIFLLFGILFSCSNNKLVDINNSSGKFLLKKAYATSVFADSLFFERYSSFKIKVDIVDGDSIKKIEFAVKFNREDGCNTEILYYRWVEEGSEDITIYDVFINDTCSLDKRGFYSYQVEVFDTSQTLMYFIEFEWYRYNSIVEKNVEDAYYIRHYHKKYFIP